MAGGKGCADLLRRVTNEKHEIMDTEIFSGML